MSKATKAVVETSFCENCDKTTNWLGLGFTNHNGFEFIECEECHISSVENFEGQDDPYRL